MNESVCEVASAKFANEQIRGRKRGRLGMRARENENEKEKENESRARTFSIGRVEFCGAFIV